MLTFQLFAEEAAAEESICEESAAAAEESVPAQEAAAEAQQADPMADAISLLEKRYAVAPGDRAALASAITRENDRMAQRRQAFVENGANRLYESWMESAQRTKETYPDFDLRSELRNPGFHRMLRSGLDVKTAYEVLHKDEIIPAAMQYAARAVESKLAAAYASSGLRPRENGVGASGAVVIGNNVNTLSRRDIADIARRVERGERISFG